MKNKKQTPLPSAINKQQGWTMWSLMISIALVIFFAYILMQLVPVFSQNRSVNNAMNIAFDRADNVRTLNRKKYIDLVQKQLYLDDAHRDIPFQKLIKLSRDKRNMTANLTYSQIVPLFLNISLKVDFEEVVTRSLN